MSGGIRHLLLAVTACVIAAPSPAALLAAANVTPNLEPVATGDPYDAAKARAAKKQVDGLVEFAAWCQKKRAYLERDRACEAVIVLDPDNAAARKYLKYKFDRKKSTWFRPRPYKAPKPTKGKAADEAHDRRAALDAIYVETMLAAVDAAGETWKPERVESELRELLSTCPDNPSIRERLGFVAFEEKGKLIWKSKVIVEAFAARKTIAEHLAKIEKEVPEFEQKELSKTESELGVEWSTVIGTKRVRLLSNAEEDEAETICGNAHLVWDLMPVIVGRRVRAPRGLTVYLVDGQSSVDAFINRFPGARDKERKQYRQLSSDWMPGGARCGCWAPEVVQRVDMVSKQMTTTYVERAFGDTWKRGWIVEGIGQYVNRIVVGTRLSFHVVDSDYVDVSAPDYGREIKNPKSSWFDLAIEVLEGGSATMIASTLGRNTNDMTAEDVLLSYALVAYVVEGHGPKTLKEILVKVCKDGESATVAFEAILGAPLPAIQADLLRWLEEFGEFGDSPVQR